MLHDKLKNLDKYPFHMPGHKRNEKFGITGAEIDITEINGFDDLHNPAGIIRETETKLSKLYSSKDSVILVNGSTAGILSTVFAMIDEGDKVIVAANCHKSVYNACVLRKLKVIIAKPDFDEKNGIYKRISQNEINRLTFDNTDIKLIIITSPTYEGYISNIKSEIPILVDAAHGAHLPFCGFGEYPKADVVISSLHKTLPALTQSAVVNIYNDKYITRIRHYLDIFETSSPSYVLMNSISICAEYLENKNSKKDFITFEKSLKNFYEGTKLNNLEFIKTDDISKINISVANCDINGVGFARILRDKYNFECESAQLRHVILMATIGDKPEIYKKLSAALIKEDKKLTREDKKAIPCPNISGKAYTFSLNNAETVKTEFKNSAGKISAEFVYAYPPGIPIIFPNDTITENKINEITQLIDNGVNITSTGKLLPRFILTKEEQ